MACSADVGSFSPGNWFTLWSLANQTVAGRYGFKPQINRDPMAKPLSALKFALQHCINGPGIVTARRGPIPYRNALFHELAHSPLYRENRNPRLFFLFQAPPLGLHVSETMKAIGGKLREIRGQQTLAAFAERLGVERTTWSNYEAGRRLPSHEVFELIFRVADVPADQILPSAPLVRTTVPVSDSGWWASIPVLWLFSKMHDEGQFQTESERLKWWAERLPSLTDEFHSRVFSLAERQDMDLANAAIRVCDDLATRSKDELQAVIEADK